MNILIISDIHGSLHYTKMVPEIFKREKADELILLGDLYYHGPRNSLPEEYDTMGVCGILNDLSYELKDKFKVIRGNCDAEVDEMISYFKFNEHILLDVNGKKIYFTHGHRNNIDELPEENFDIMVYGHLHTGFIKEKDGKIFANTGSISLPKNNTKHSYLVINDNEIILKEVNGEIIEIKDIK